MNLQVYTKDPSSSVSPSKNYNVKVNNTNIFVYQCEVANYALFSAEGSLNVEIKVRFPFNKVKIRPLSLGIEPHVDGATVRFELSEPKKLSIEFDDDIRNPLFLFINSLEIDKPDPGDSKVKYYEGGKVHDAGLIELKAGETLYLEEGALVYGAVLAHKADNVRIMGRGILDGSKWPCGDYDGRMQAIRVIESRNAIIEGITLVSGANWHVVPIACDDVSIRDINVVTYIGTGDGIDIVGCRNVTVDNVFVRSMDDCIAIKAVDYFHSSGCRNVENIRITGSVFWNAEWGNALEIGYETRCEEIKDIVFENCDVIHCELEGYQSGGTFTIHNGDRAVISNIRYENIRIEDSREKLIDIKVLFSQYSRDEERGRIRDIHFKDIQVVDGPFPVSIIRGYDGDHMIENVLLENLTVHGQKVENANHAKMVVELSNKIKFK